MTSPVFMNEGTGQEETGKGRMSFMLPIEVANAGAPTPNGEDLSIGEIKSGHFAVLRFKGWADAKSQTTASAKLSEFVSKNKLTPAGQTFFAFYDPPWTPELLRRNEVWQRIEPTH